MKDDPYVFCGSRCEHYPHCLCWEKMKGVVSGASIKTPADTLAKWKIEVDNETGSIKMTNLSLDNETEK